MTDSKYVRLAKLADTISRFLIEAGYKPEIRSDFSVQVEIGGMIYVVTSLSEARKIVS